MSDPILYEKSSEQTIADFKTIFDVYSKILTFPKYKRVIDVGCGPGNITAQLLRPYLSNDLEKLIGVDISTKMIQHAQKYHTKDPKIQFQVLDITTKELPKGLQNEFDLVTSFYCLQVVANIKQIFQNMYDMLKPGGEVFLYFMGRCFALDIWENLAESSKWGSYMTNYKIKMCPVHRSAVPEEFVKNMVEEIGFKVNLCKMSKHEKVYKKEKFLDLMKSINTFDIPTHLEDDFILDHLNLFRLHKLIKIDEEGKEKFRYQYGLLTLHAKKPL